MASAVASVPLAPIDHIAAWNIPQSVIYLGLKPGVNAQDAFDHLQEGLRRTLLQFPWLHGRVHYRSQTAPDWRPGQLEIRHSRVSEGPQCRIHFKALNTDLSFEDLKLLGFPLDAFKEEDLLPASPFEPNFAEGSEVLTAQANFLPGGCALAIAVAAPVADGTAMLSITRIWADHCSSIADSDGGFIKSLPAHLSDALVHREALSKICEQVDTTSQLSQVSDKIHRLVGLDVEEPVTSSTACMAVVSDTDRERENNMQPRLFYLSHAAYTALRKEGASKSNTGNMSGNDLICALIWRSTVRAWAAVHALPNSSDALASLSCEAAIPFDARLDFADALPPNFLGNFNFENRLALPVSHLIGGDTSIAGLAKLLRSHASTFGNRASIAYALKVLDAVSDYRKLTQIRASRMRAPSVGILSPLMLPFNEACFGAHIFANAGLPEAFRPLMGACNAGFRTNFVMPRKPHGGVEFVMNLSERELKFLRNDAEFKNYCSHMA